MAAMAKRNKIRRDRRFDIISTLIGIVVLIVTLYPLYFILIASISNPDLTNAGKVSLYPKAITWEGYRALLHDGRTYLGYRNTIIYTAVGTFISVALTMTCGYGLSRPSFRGKRLINFFIMFTMIFSGGLVPTYLLVKSLNMIDKIWAIVIPGCVGVWNLIITRTFLSSNIPGELFESAQLDGCSHFRFFFSIVLPLSSVIIAVITLFYAVNQWNGFFSALIYLYKPERYPLQLFLRQILIQQQQLQMDPDAVEDMRYSANLVRYAMIIVASLPIMCVYPFLQRYFVKGVMIGSVKG